MTDSDRVGWRQSVVTRLLLVVVIVAATAVGATAWLAVHTTTDAISRQQGQSLAAQERDYAALLAYAVDHRDWSDVGAELHRLARAGGGRVTLTTASGRVLADSAAVSDAGTAPTGRPAAVVDPLDLSASDPITAAVGRTTGVAATDGIDSRVVGPYQLTDAEQESLRRQSAEQYACARKFDARARLVVLAGGRPVVRFLARAADEGARICARQYPVQFPVASERTPLRELTRSLDSCLGLVHERVRIGPGFTLPSTSGLPVDVTRSGAASCLASARRAQLRPYVAPPAYLYLGGDPVSSARSVRLTRGSVLRIVAVSAAVLALAVLAALLLSRRIARPLRSLTQAARRPQARAAEFEVDARDEVGVLGRALARHIARREDSERQRTALVSDVAHELRSPVTTMRGWLEAADAGLATTDQALVGLLLDEVQLLQEVLDDLRDLAAADAGTLRVRPERVDADRELVRVVDGRRAAAEHAAVQLSADLAAGVPTCVDPVRLRQMVGNLVDNALVHTPAGGQVTVRSWQDDAGLVVEVADTGSGIAPEHLARVFERFWRADPSRSRSTGGSGLGLPVVRQLALAHGGSVAVSSTLGQGTTVTVRLPDRTDPGRSVGLTPS